VRERASERQGEWARGRVRERAKEVRGAGGSRRASVSVPMLSRPLSLVRGLFVCFSFFFVFFLSFSRCLLFSLYLSLSLSHTLWVSLYHCPLVARTCTYMFWCKFLPFRVRVVYPVRIRMHVDINIHTRNTHCNTHCNTRYNTHCNAHCNTQEITHCNTCIHARNNA